MKFITKKRTVLFLLFIFPLICFLLLSTGINNFTKLPTVSKNLIDITSLDSTKTLKNKVSVVCFLGSDIDKAKAGVFNVNEKIYKDFIDHQNFQVLAIYPSEKEEDVQQLKKQMGIYTDLRNWSFVEGTNEEITSFYAAFKTGKPLQNLFINEVYLVDKKGDLRGRINEKDTTKVALYGYNMFSVSELSKKMEDDIKVLYYEYYAAFKTKNVNKANRKKFEL